MRLIKNTTELIGIKNPNIIISLVFENGYSYRGSSKTGLSCIRNYFLKYPLKVRQKVRFITMDMSGSYMPLVRRLFLNAQIIIDCFHIIQQLDRAFLKTRIAIMNQFNKNSLPYWDLKNHWRLFQKDSRKLSLNSFHSKTFRQTLVPHEIIEKTLVFSEEIANAYKLYQLLLFHFQEKRVD